MSNIDEIPEEGGFVDWDRLEGKQDNSKPKKKRRATDDELDEDVVEELKSLTEEEKESPYPDDFLADVNSMRKNFGINNLDISHLKDTEEKEDQE